MRYRIAMLGMLAAVGCTQSKDDEETDTDTDTDTDTASDFHPLVPEQYRYLWNTEGCETDDGLGATVYRYTEDATSDGTQFNATEQWFWFFPEDGWDADCIDTFSLVGDLANFDYGQLGCSGCEEGYAVERKLTQSNCNINYSTLFGYEEPEDITEFDGVLLFDSFTPNETPNEDNKMLVIAGTRVTGNSYSMDIDYARGHAFGESEEYFPPGPANYDWVGNTCVKIN